MKIITHEFIGKIISDIYNFLDETTFIKGCIEPDKNISMILIPHTKERTLSNVIEILESNFNSFNLGMVCHYLSDYCCYFHNGSFFFNVLEHYIYERNLHKIVNSLKITSLVKISKRISANLINEDYESIINIITTKYRSKKTTMKRDLFYNYILNLIIFDIYFKRNQLNTNIHNSLYHKAVL